MHKEETIIQSIFKNIFFTEKEKEIISENFHKISVKKGDVLLNDDEIVDYTYYVESGCLRAFFCDESGKEHTIQFAITDWWLSDFTAFFSKSKSIIKIECLKDAVLHKLYRDDLEEMYKEIPKLEIFFRLKLENAYASFQRRTLDKLSKSTKERYLEFISSYPEIVKHIKNYHIASYLGTTTETLSRLRRIIK